MSGSGPVSAARLGLPAPRQESVRSAEPTPDGAVTRSEVPTEAHAAIVDDPADTGSDRVAVDLLELLGAGSPGPGPSGSEPPGSELGDFEPHQHFEPHQVGPPRIEAEPITRTNGVWLWLWGPLLVAVVVVSFLGGMVSAPVALPSAAQAHPAAIVDVRGRPLDTVDPPASAEQLPADQLPELLLRSVVAVQDPGYFSRRSLSAADLVKAGAADVMRVRRRGTTIEERYARQVGVAAGSQLPSLRESTVAVRLSQRLSRRALLTRYVNGMYFGNGVYGIAAAARFYFGVQVTSLDAAQIGLLVGVADDPSRHNPVTAPAQAIHAQQSALGAMRDAGLLTPAQSDAAVREPVDARAHRQLERPSAAPDFTALVESSLLSRFGDDVVYGQDLQVVTPLDLDLQTALGETVRRLVPTNVPAVLAVATDPRSGDIRAMLNRGPSSSATGPEGASDVLFSRRPLGTLAGALPTRVGDGGSASLGEVAAAVGAVAADGIRHDLRPLTGVTRPAAAGRPAEILDLADPLPVGRQILARDAASSVTGTYRATARAGGSEAAGLPFALAVVAGTTNGQSWYIGCVPDLCLTVWTGAPGVDLPASIVVQTFRQYLAAAPGRITLPSLPQPPAESQRPASTPVVTTTPAPTPTSTVPLSPAPSVAPTGKARPSVTPTPTGSTPTPKPSPSPGTAAAGGDAAGPPNGTGTTPHDRTGT